MKSNPAQTDNLIYSNEIRARNDSVCQPQHSLHLDEEKQAHQVVVGVSAAALHDVHVLTPNRVVDVHVRLSCNIRLRLAKQASLTIIVETELCAGDGHPAVATQPLAQLGVGEASEHLHVMIGHRIRHLGG